MTLEEALKRLEWKAQDLKKFSDDGRYMGLRSELSSGTCYELGVEILQEITAIKEALAQPAVAEQHKQEPKCIGKAWAMWGGPVVFDPPLAQPEQRKPLTDEQLLHIYVTTKGFEFYRVFARAIEAAHGIKE